MYNIDYSINNFTIEFDQESYLNINKESAIRGIIGQVLLTNYCIKDKKCSTCDFKENCVAANFFEHLGFSEIAKSPRMNRDFRALKMA